MYFGYSINSLIDLRHLMSKKSVNSIFPGGNFSNKSRYSTALLLGILGLLQHLKRMFWIRRNIS